MNEFSYWLEITRAVKKDDGLYIEGEASNTEIDAYDTVFTERCQEGFVGDINRAYEDGNPIAIEVEHKGDEADVFNIGAIIEGFLDNNKTKIVARLDNDNPFSTYYHKILTSTPEENRMAGRSEKLGFSIRGVVREVEKRYNPDMGKMIPHFERVELRKVGLTKQPANVECYAEAIKRSFTDLDNDKGDEVERVQNQDNEVVETETVTEVAEVERTEENAEVVTEETTEVVEETVDGQEQEETEAVSESTDEQTEVGSDQVAEVEKEEVIDPKENAEGATVGETVVETAETPEVKVEEVEVVAERTESETVVEETVERGMLKNVLVSREIEELNWAFSDSMFAAVHFTSEEDRVNAMRSVVEDYATLMGEIMSKRSLNAGDSSLQKQDLDDEVSYSLKDRFAARSLKASEVVRNLDLSKEEELNRSLDDLKVKYEEVTKENEELKRDKESLSAKVTELENLPASNPVSSEVIKRNEVKEKIEIIKRNRDKDAAARMILGFQ